MRNKYFLIIIIFIAGCCRISYVAGQASILQIDSLLNLGLKSYDTRPDSSLLYLKAAGMGYAELELFSKAGNMYLNVAGLFEENFNKYDSAMVYAKYSLSNYILANDSMQMANLKKYYGYLLGLNGLIDEGILKIVEAEKYYDRIDFQEGVAVCKFNHARLLYLRKDFILAKSLLIEAQNIWILNKNYTRIFLVKLLEIEINLELNNKSEVHRLLLDCEQIIQNNKLPEQSINRFRVLKTRI